jgi:hypothetical protein
METVRVIEQQMLTGIDPVNATTVQTHLELFVRNLRG